MSLFVKPKATATKLSESSFCTNNTKVCCELLAAPPNTNHQGGDVPPTFEERKRDFIPLALLQQAPFNQQSLTNGEEDEDEDQHHRDPRTLSVASNLEPSSTNPTPSTFVKTTTRTRSSSLESFGGLDNDVLTDLSDPQIYLVSSKTPQPSSNSLKSEDLERFLLSRTNSSAPSTIATAFHQHHHISLQPQYHKEEMPFPNTLEEFLASAPLSSSDNHEFSESEDEEWETPAEYRRYVLDVRRAHQRRQEQHPYLLNTSYFQARLPRQRLF